MLTLYHPKLQDLWFREKILADEETMAYNRAWGGTIDFSESIWEGWYARWVQNADGNRFYRYLQKENGEFVGEAAYRVEDGRYIASIIIYAPCRGNGCGREALRLLCEAAKQNGADTLWDDIAADNTAALCLFESEGFTEEERKDGIVFVKKVLTE